MTHRKLHIVGDSEALVRPLNCLQQSCTVSQPDTQQPILICRNDASRVHQSDNASNCTVMALVVKGMREHTEMVNTDTVSKLAKLKVVS